jgi:hypothetical protein
MYRFALPMIASASALALSGCGTGNDSADADNRASGRTENGQLTARVQGVDLKVNLPPPIRRMTESDDLLPPRARTLRGGAGQRFHSDDSVENVAGWYRDPARASRFAILDSTRDDAAWTLTGTTRGGDAFSVRLTAAAGGTDGMVVVTPAH